MTRSTATALACLLLAGATIAPREARAEVPPAPTRWVTDGSGFLSPGARQDLDERLQAYQRQTGHHVLVWIGGTTNGAPIEDFAVRSFAAWKVGRKGLDDGLVLFVLADDRQVRIEVGYGLEGQVPDAIASRIIREGVVPRILAGDHDGAIRAGVDGLTAAIEGRAWAPEGGARGAAPRGQRSRGPARPIGVGQMILFGIVAVGFLILLVTHPRLALYLLFSVLASGRGGGGSGGGGGYSGGGGRSGGGGASGSW